MLNIGLLHFPLLLDPCFLAFYTISAFKSYIPPTLKCLIENHYVFSYLFHGFIFIRLSRKDIQYHRSCAKVSFPDLKQAYIAVYSFSIIGHTVLSSIALVTSSFGPSPLISLQPPHNWMVLIEGRYGWSSETEK